MQSFNVICVVGVACGLLEVLKFLALVLRW